MNTELNGLMVNLDNSFFFGWHPQEEMTVKGVLDFVDQYVGTQVSDLQFCLNSQRSSVTCSSRQTVWDGYDPTADNQHCSLPVFATGLYGRAAPTPASTCEDEFMAAGCCTPAGLILTHCGWSDAGTTACADG
jgi:hypothetical protein